MVEAVGLEDPPPVEELRVRCCRGVDLLDWSMDCE